MDAVKNILERRLAELRRDRTAVQEEISELEATAADIRVRIEELETVLTASSSPGVYENGVIDNTGPVEINSPTTNGHLHGATEAVLNYFRENPSLAAKPGDIVSAVIDNVNTNAKDRRHALYNTVYNLIRAGRLTKTQSGRVKLSKAQ